ncbi:myb family transcription factor PHL8-like isoform X1 [Zingiber officinale]|uniref:myb family transcription factor PHL8-like isoform X1 n=1 Tax=Zingiber officinale TaxID=94328 RepID=UPI001C4CB82B|nr:myb family transcription factor PHL8-like isoform X1 [Zingiber officinale]
MDSKEVPGRASREGIVAKQRLKWTRQLHEMFVVAVSQLGGADKATPKAVMRKMEVPGLTLHHLKSHLQVICSPIHLLLSFLFPILFSEADGKNPLIQKYRLAKDQDSKMLHQQNNLTDELGSHDQENGAQPECETMLRMQMEMRSKLQQQIEVQRHLQLRIEAQGKYLQSVLKKAQETLAGYSENNTTALEAAKTELAELVSAVETGTLRYLHGERSNESCLTCVSNLSGESDELNSKSMKRMRREWNDELFAVKRCSRNADGEDEAEQHSMQELDLNL